MGDQLSQEELDKLLAEAAGGGGAASPGGSSADLEPDDFERLRRVYEPGWSKLARNMSQGLGQPIAIEFGVAANTTGATLSEDIDALGVFLSFTVGGAVTGSHGIVFESAEIAKLAAVIETGDAQEGALGAEQLQTVQDFLDMSLPIVADALTAAVGQAVSVADLAAVATADPSVEVDLEALGLAGSLVRMEYSLTVGDAIACPLLYFLPAEHAVHLLAAAPESADTESMSRPTFAEFDSAHTGAGRAGAAEPSAGGNMDLILDIQLEVVARLGQVEMPIREILKLGPGAIIDIDRPADAPVDLVVNDKLVARGDVVVVQENFGLKITDVQSPQERIASLR